MTDERIDWRPHGFEIILFVNLVVIYLLTRSHTQAVLTTLPVTLFAAGITLVGQAVVTVLIRIMIGVIRGNVHEYVAIIRRPAWLLETARLIFSGALMVHVYGWIKIAIPLLHPRLFDQELWTLDRALFFGISPNILIINLFSAPDVLRVVDLTYGPIFMVGLFVAFGYFASSPSKRLRVAFMTGHAVMWITGAWLYVLVPSLGPAYRFPDIWLQYSESLRTTQRLQAMLWANYSAVLKLREPGATTPTTPINIVLGVAAFPSMHVAFQTFLFLWFRRIWKWGEVLFAIFVLMIFLGAMITGWHYLVDLIAGMLLAWIVWAVTARRYRVLRFTELSGIS